MSAIDDLIARDAGASAPAGVDAIIARDAGPQAAAQASPGVPPTQPAAGQPQGQWQAPNSFVMGMGDAIKGGVQGIVHGGAWLANQVAPNSQFTHDINAAIPQVDQTIHDQDQQYTAQRQAQQPPTLSGLITGQKADPGVDWGRLGGNLVGAAPMALAAPETAGMGLAGRTLVGAGMGAANSVATTPVTDTSTPYAQQKLGQAAGGALVGGATVPLATMAGNAVSGVTGAAQQRLAQVGVNMTPGQMLGGAWQRTEDKLTSVPILGDFIKNAQQRSVQSFNRATYNNALEPINATVAPDIPAGSDAITAVRNAIGHVYDSITPRATFVADQNFAGDLAGIRANLAQNAPGTLQQFDNIVQNQVTNKLQNQSLTGAQWGNTRSEINGIARNQTLGNATPDNRSLADALGQLNDAINAGVARSSPPDIIPTLRNANSAWARYKQIENAAGMAGASNNGNVFTAAQFQNAVRRGSTSGQKATNSGLNGQFGADAQDVLGSKYPDSGTAGRSLLTLGLGAAAGHAVAPAAMIPAGVGIGLASLPYTTYGQRLAQGLLMNRPAFAAPAGQAISGYGPALGTALAGLAR